MKNKKEPIIKEERNNERTRRFTGIIQKALAKILQSTNDVDKKMFRGNNLGYENPIFIPRRGKLKGYMRENRRRCTFNKNK
jgi:predicted metalloprotease